MRRVILSLLAVLLSAQCAIAVDFHAVIARKNSGPRLTWTALGYNSSTYAMELQSTGTGTPTLSRTTTQYCLDGVTGYYVAATANNPCWKGARYSGGVAYADNGSGVLLSPLPLLQVDPALTNSLFHSSNLTGWTQSGTSVSAYNAVGLTGSANTATTLTDDNASSHEYVQKTSIGIDTNTNYNTLVVYTKKDSDQTRFPFVGFHLGGTILSGYQFNTQTGAITTDSAVTNDANSSASSESVGLFWKFMISTKNDGTKNYCDVYVMPARASVFGTAAMATIGSAVYGNIELHKNKTIAQVRGTGPIFTTTGAVTTGAQTGPTWDSGSISDTSGLITFRASTEGANNFLSTFAGHDGSNVQIADGTTTDTAVAAVSTTHKIGVWWHTVTNNMGICLNGTCNAAVAYDGTILSGNLDAIRSAAYSGQIGYIQGYQGGNATSYQTQAVTDTTP